MTARLLPEASAEIREAVRYYNGQRAGLGREFRAEVDATIDRIKSFPEGCQVVSENYRRCRIHRFPYGVFYRIQDDEIIIVAVAHFRREQGYWMVRQ